MDMTICVEILDESVYIFHNANILGKGINPTILSPATSKYQEKLGSLALVW